MKKKLNLKKLFKKHKWKLIVTAIILLLIVVMVYPVPQIVEDRPIMAFICEVQPFSYVGKCGSFVCDNEQDYTFKMLEEWTLYKGCNNSTKGYDVKGGISAGSLKCCKVTVLT